jgi:hypothetical protein
LQIRFGPNVTAQLKISEWELRLSQPMSMYDVVVVLFSLLPRLLAAVPKRASPEIITRFLQVTRRGVRLGISDELLDPDQIEVDVVGE